MPPRPLVVVTCCLAILGKTGLAQALEWATETSVRAGLEYNDNIFLTTLPHEAVAGANLGVNLDALARQETWELRGGARLVSRRYESREDLNTDDVTAILSYYLKTDRNLWQLNGSYASQSVLNSDTVDPDIGLTQKQTKRATSMAIPAWTWQPSETTQLRLDYQFADAQYQDGVRAGYLDYRQQYTSIKLSEQLSPRTNVYALASYSDFRVTTPEDDITTPYTAKSRTNTGQIGITYDFTETLKGSLSGGPRRTESEDVTQTLGFCGFFLCLIPVTQSNTEYGSVFTGSLESQQERTRTTLRFSRTVGPSGSGSEVQTGNLHFGVNHQITPLRFSAQFIAEGYAFRALGQVITGDDRNFYRLEPGLRWRWTEDLTVEATYRYSRQRYVDAPEVAKSNSINLVISYIVPKLSISR